VLTLSPSLTLISFTVPLDGPRWVLHLHRLEDDELLVFLHGIARLHDDLLDRAGHGAISRFIGVSPPFCILFF